MKSFVICGLCLFCVRMANKWGSEGCGWMNDKKTEQKKEKKERKKKSNPYTHIHACYNFDQALFDGQTSLTKDNFYQWMCAAIRSTLWISIEYVELRANFWMNADYRRSYSKSVYPFKVTLFICFRFNFFF